MESLVKHESEAGDAMSQYILGMMHLGGYGSVAQDAQETIKWLRAAAMQGFAPAQCALGYMFYLGCEVDADPKEGEIWLKAAARSGNAIAKWALLRSDADLKKAVEDYRTLHDRKRTQPGWREFRRSRPEQGDATTFQRIDFRMPGSWSGA